MQRGRAARAAVVASLAWALVLVGAQTGMADPFKRWSGKLRPYAWEGKRLACGAVGQPSRVRAHSRWRTSPANGYQRVTFARQFQAEGTGAWRAVQRATLSTRDKALEGTRGVLHWRMSFPTFAGHAGRRTRYVIIFRWLRDRRATDRFVFGRTLRTRPCIVGS